MSKYPIIVLEGGDGSGKTTLARHLCQAHGFAYLHLKYRWPRAMFHYHWAALEYCLRLAETQPVVLDRWYMSELIYAAVFRGGSRWPLAPRLFDRVAIKHGITNVYCLPSDDEKYRARFEALKATGRELYPAVKQIHANYVKFYNALPTRLDSVHYDIDTHGQDLASYARWLIEVSQLICEPLPYFCIDRLDRRFAGNIANPTFLLVGDASNSKFNREVWPFFEYGNSSLWLAKALEAASIHEHELAWVNVNHRGKVQHKFISNLHETVSGSNEPKVVALGHQAATVLKNMSIPHELVKHPQWSRRFDPLNFSEYLSL